MTSPRRTPYVSMNVTVPTRDALQRATLRLSADMGKRLPLSVVLLAALAVARAHPAEFNAAAALPLADLESAATSPINFVAEPNGETQ